MTTERTLVASAAAYVAAVALVFRLAGLTPAAVVELVHGLRAAVDGARVLR